MIRRSAETIQHDFSTKEHAPGIVAALVWLMIVIGFAAFAGSDSHADTTSTWVGRGVFVASAGLGPPSLWLAYVRTNHQKEQLADENFNKALLLLAKESLSARRSGIHILGRLAVENDRWFPAILRSLASHLSAVSIDKRIEFERESKNQGRSEQVESNSLPQKEPLRESDAALMRRVRNNPLVVPPTETALIAITEIIRKKGEAYEKMVGECRERTYTLDLSHAILSGGALKSANLDKCNFSEILVSVYLFDETSFKRANLVGAWLGDCDFEGCDFSEAELDGATFEETTFSNRKEPAPNEDVASPKKTKCVGTTFVGASFKRVEFSSVDLTSADFRNARLEDFKMDDSCVLKDANFEGAEISIRAEDEEAMKKIFAPAKNVNFKFTPVA